MSGHDVVGFACSIDCSGCQPLTREQAENIFNRADDARRRREREMPTQQDALHALHQAYTRLCELGWREAIYCPKDGSTFDAIEAGSTGIHACHYEGEWPSGSWWVADAGDVWPSRPILFRLAGNSGP